MSPGLKKSDFAFLAVLEVLEVIGGLGDGNVFAVSEHEDLGLIPRHLCKSHVWQQARITPVLGEVEGMITPCGLHHELVQLNQQVPGSQRLCLKN